VGKLLAERLSTYYAAEFGMEARSARFHNVYGPYGTYDGGREKAPAALCRKVALAEPGGTIEIWGDGEQTRSFCYVADCVEGIYRLMQSDYREPLNLGTDELVTINQLAAQIIELSGKSGITVRHVDGPQGVRGLPVDRAAGQPRLSRPPTAIPRVDVLGIGISAIDMRQAVAEITRWVEQREPHYVCVTGVHGVMEARCDPELRRIHNASGLTTLDGMPMVWAGHWAGVADMGRVRGADLMSAVCALAAERGWSSYFYGGDQGVPELLAERLIARFPGLRVAGTWSPPFRPLTPDEDRMVVEAINRSAPDLVWVGLSTPKQERWMAAHTGRLDAPAVLGVGAAFDMHAGLMPQAPQWMQQSGLEWLYRLRREPKRLWRRYLRNNPRFVVETLRRPPVLRAAGELR
jgi:N-acetylglucosaminyldiphosphoundecaprenol N-acetyl-beta-D-mannosaminyltransferase